jgi:hypothetical protein
VKHRQAETEVVKNFRNLQGKSREITLGEIILGGFSTFGTTV